MMSESEMSISNRKPGDKKEAPAEPLKRSIAGCMRAVAQKQDLEVRVGLTMYAFERFA